MNDRRVRAFGMMIDKRRRLDERLGVTLAAQRAQQAELDAIARERRAALDAQLAKLDAQRARLDAMASGAARLAPSDYCFGLQYRDALEDRRIFLEGDWREAHAVLEAKSAEVAGTLQEIRVNQTRMDAYIARVEALERAWQQRIDDEQDEESQESHAARCARGGRRL